jgi:hypothetical protein
MTDTDALLNEYGRFTAKHKLIIALDSNDLMTHRGQVLQKLLQTLDHFKGSKELEVKCLLTPTLLQEQTGQFRPLKNDNFWNKFIQTSPESFIVASEDMRTHRVIKHTFREYLKSKNINPDSKDDRVLDEAYQAALGHKLNFKNKDRKNFDAADRMSYELAGAGELSVADYIISNREQYYETPTTFMYVTSDDQAIKLIGYITSPKSGPGPIPLSGPYTDSPDLVSSVTREKLNRFDDIYNRTENFRKAATSAVTSPEQFLEFTDALVQNPLATVENLSKENFATRIYKKPNRTDPERQHYEKLKKKINLAKATMDEILNAPENNHVSDDNKTAIRELFTNCKHDRLEMFLASLKPLSSIPQEDHEIFLLDLKNVAESKSITSHLDAVKAAKITGPSIRRT